MPAYSRQQKLDSTASEQKCSKFHSETPREVNATWFGVVLEFHLANDMKNFAGKHRQNNDLTGQIGVLV
jgi:hypothetical protein